MRELSFGEILDVGFRLFKRLIGKFAGLYLLIGIPLILIYTLLFVLFFKNRLESAGTLGLSIVLLVFIILVPGIIVAFGIIKGSVIHLTAERYLNRPTKIIPAINFAWDRFGAYLGTAILWALSVGCGYLCLVLPGIFLNLILTFTFHAVFIDRLSGVDAFKRSWNLFKGNAGKVTGYFFLAFFIQQITGYIPQMIMFFIGILNVGHAVTISAAIIAFLTYFFFAFVVFTYIPIVWTVLYFDSRCRIEAFDLEILARDIERPKEPKKQ